MSLRAASAVILVASSVFVTACGGSTVPVRTTPQPPTRQQLAELWIDPGQTPRNLFWGVGVQRYAPPRRATYTVTNRDPSGFSVGYDVTSPDGTEWSVKIGPEAQTEVVVSRLLLGLGYHQPPIYYLPSWTAKAGSAEPRIESEGRFRPKLPALVREDDYWKWAENPYVGTRQLNGLLVIMLMLNSTDLKDDNNSIYKPKTRWDGATRWFVARDVGAALGETGRLYPRRNWLEGFEKQGFITRIEGNRVEFDYDGLHQDMLKMITPPDVRWAAQRMQRLTSAQWKDAFRAGNYNTLETERYTRRIRQKIDDGLALRARTSRTEESR